MRGWSAGGRGRPRGRTTQRRPGARRRRGRRSVRSPCEEEGAEVHDGERPVAEQLGRDQRVGRPSDVGDEPGRGQDRHDQSATTPASPQPRTPASVSAQVPHAADDAEGDAALSSLPVACSSRLSGTAVRAHTMTTTETGTLIRKPTPSRSVHQGAADEGPDGAGDTAERRPRADGHRPVGLSEARLEDGHAPGVRSAPPTPCRIRVATSTPTLGAMPHSSDATANHAVPMRKIRLLPRRSPSAPASRMNEASPSR